MHHGLDNEHDYDLERAERRRGTGPGLTRRGLLRTGAAAVGAASLGGLMDPSRAWAYDTPIVKPIPDSLFISRSTNAEMRFEAMRGQGYLTPIDRFFVRNHTATPEIDVASWRLRVHGSAVRRELSLSYDDLLRLPSVTTTKAIECAGNGRSFFASQQGQPTPGTPWTLGAVGVARWTGVPLSHLLDRARTTRNALDVMPVGLDTMQVRRPIPYEKALEHDTLVVFAMNGQPLPPDHGFPVRLLVPGWVGVANVKWIDSIEVSETPLTSPWNTTSYRLFGPDYPDTPLLTEQVVKSALELPFPATLAAGKQLLTGRSWSGHGRIVHVDVSTDGGNRWRSARLHHRNEDRAWRRWSIPWDAQPGEQTIRVRARDSRGNVQPTTVPFNEQGYLFGAVVAHPVTVL